MIRNREDQIRIRGSGSVKKSYESGTLEGVATNLFTQKIKNVQYGIYMLVSETVQKAGQPSTYFTQQNWVS